MRVRQEIGVEIQSTRCPYGKLVCSVLVRASCSASTGRNHQECSYEHTTNGPQAGKEGFYEYALHHRDDRTVPLRLNVESTAVYSSTLVLGRPNTLFSPAFQRPSFVNRLIRSKRFRTFLLATILVLPFKLGCKDIFSILHYNLKQAFSITLGFM